MKKETNIETFTLYLGWILKGLCEEGKCTADINHVVMSEFENVCHWEAPSAHLLYL